MPNKKNEFEYILSLNNDHFYLSDNKSTEKISDDKLISLVNSITTHEIKGFINFNNSSLIISFENGSLILMNYKEILKKEEFKDIKESYKKYLKGYNNNIKLLEVTKAAIAGSGIALMVIAGSTVINQKIDVTNVSGFKEEPITATDHNKIIQENNSNVSNSAASEISAVLNNDQKVANLNVTFTSNTDSDKFINATNNYGDTIKKYAIKYGLDPHLILAICTQERGIHSTNIDDGGGLGLMQIQTSIHHDGEEISTTTFSNGMANDSTFTFYQDKYKTVDGNIEAGCALFRSYLNDFNGNIIAAIYAYNCGNNKVQKAITTYAASKNLSYDDVINNINDYGWSESLYNDDLDYLKLVMEYYNSDSLSYYMVKNDEITKMEYNIYNLNNKQQKR